MSAECTKVHLFWDGELPPEEAKSFRLHLPECAKCQRELEVLSDLDLLGTRHIQQHGVTALKPAPVGRVPWWGYAGMAAAACALVAAGVGVLRGRGPSVDVWLAQAPQRLAEARVSLPEADRYRPLAARMMSARGTSSGQLPLEALAELEKRNEHHGLAAAYLVRGDRNMADEALQQLSGLESSPGVESDRAVALLLKGELEEALRRVDSALEREPRHPQALWNRGLILRELGLPLLAARAFEAVAELGEPGWSDEARQRAAALRDTVEARRRKWETASAVGKALIAGTVPPEESADVRQPVLRLYFYDAVRAAPSAERVRALLPLARALDRAAGGDALERHVRRVAASDFGERAPLARAYADYLRGALSETETQTLLTRLLRSKQDDLLMGLLVLTRKVPEHLETFAALARASGDPWFEALAAHEQAKVERARSEPLQARRTLDEAVRACQAARVEYRCLGLEVELSGIYLALTRLDEAWTHASRGFVAARAAAEWEWELDFLETLAMVARFRNDFSLARAFLAEALERTRGDRVHQHYVLQDLANVELQALRFDRARLAIDEAIQTGLPLTLPGALVLMDIARVMRAPGDDQVLERALAAPGTVVSPGQAAMATYVRGSYAIEREREKGRALLRQAIREAEADRLLERDGSARRARAYSYTALILDEGRAGAFEAALDLFAEELATRVPPRCALAVTADSERSLLIARDGTGRTLGRYEGDRRTRLPFDLQGFVPDEMLAALRPCERVEVLARPPLHGRPGLLPPDMVWSYRTRSTEPPALPGRAVHLVVTDVSFPADAPGLERLQRLSAWNPEFGESEARVVLRGDEATPSRVLAEMAVATEVDVAAHGIVREASDASYLVLAPEATGFELTATRIREHRLSGAPLVILAACHAAHAAPVLHERSSLPAAFIDAGARAVIAAAAEIPDVEAARFFNAVRARVRAGAAPAVALRDERVQWLREGKGAAWLGSILVFE